MIFSEKPAIIGHRGSGSHAVEENSIDSLRAATAAGASWIEIDVQRTLDDTLVLRHNPTTAGGDFLVELTAADSGLPRLTEIFEALPPEIGINLDIKTILEDAVDAPARRTGPLLVPLLAAEARRRPLLVTSFDAALLSHLRDNLPGVPLGLLTWMTFPAGHAVAAAAGLGLQAVALHTGSLTGRPRSAEHTVRVAHEAGLEVLVWCPIPEEVPGFVAAGVNGLIVDDVRGTVEALAS